MRTRHKLLGWLYHCLLCASLCLLVGCDANPPPTTLTPTDGGNPQLPGATTATANVAVLVVPDVAELESGNPPRLFISGKDGSQRANVGPFCWTKGCVTRFGTRVPDPPLEVAISESLLITNSFGLLPTEIAVNIYPFPSEPEKVGEYDGDAYYFYWRNKPKLHVELTASQTLTYAVNLAAGDYILMLPTKWLVGAPGSTTRLNRYEVSGKGGQALYAFHIRVR